MIFMILFFLLEKYFFTLRFSTTLLYLLYSLYLLYGTLNSDWSIKVLCSQLFLYNDC